MVQSGDIKSVEVGLQTSELLCPRCGGQYLHHYGATFFERREDGDQEVVIDVAGPKVVTTIEGASKTGNPSSRRHGMLIHFECEFCSGKGGNIALAIAQHKGATEISWRFDALPGT